MVAKPSMIHRIFTTTKYHSLSRTWMKISRTEPTMKSNPIKMKSMAAQAGVGGM
jgi:hypothetical protein